jgi:hypothetical protein
MGRRVGANSRKRKTERRKKRPSKTGFMKYMSTGVLYAGMFAAGTALYMGFKDRMPDLTGITGHLIPKRSQVESVVMQGAVHVAPEEIIRRSGIKLPVTMDKLKREYLYMLSKASPWIEKVNFTTAKKGQATLSVVERKPKVMMQMMAGAKIMLVDADGVCIPLDPHAVRTLPLVSGLSDSIAECGIHRLTAGDCERMNRFFSSAAAVDTGFIRHITQVHFSADGIVRILMAGSPTVITIDENETTARLQRLMLVWEALSADSLRPGRIDLSCRNLAFVSMPLVKPERAGLRPAGAAKQTDSRSTKHNTRL